MNKSNNVCLLIKNDIQIIKNYDFSKLKIDEICKNLDN